MDIELNDLVKQLDRDDKEVVNSELKAHLKASVFGVKYFHGLHQQTHSHVNSIKDTLTTHALTSESYNKRVIQPLIQKVATIEANQISMNQKIDGI